MGTRVPHFLSQHCYESTFLAIIVASLMQRSQLWLLMIMIMLILMRHAPLEWRSIGRSGGRAVGRASGLLFVAVRGSVLLYRGWTA